MGRRDGALCLVGALALAPCACGLADDGGHDEELELRDDDGGVPAPSGRPSGGGWISNGLEDPDVSGIDPAHGLSTVQGMAEDIGLLTDTDLRGTAEYVVECALPLGESITKIVDGQTLELDGLLGLAPQWQDGACDESCQQWVSACLLARTNVSGQNVTIWIQADHPAIGYGVPDGLIHEASWYGNLFAGSEEQYLCKGAPTGPVAAKRDGRTCSLGQQCGFTMYPHCDVGDRCTMAGPDDDVPVGCTAGNPPQQGPGQHTISSYVEL
jgi:hypothetical protein